MDTHHVVQDATAGYTQHTYANDASASFGQRGGHVCLRHVQSIYGFTCTYL